MGKISKTAFQTKMCILEYFNIAVRGLPVHCHHVRRYVTQNQGVALGKEADGKACFQMNYTK
jgi:hypothetical protein